MRVFAWFEHTGTPATVHDFLGTADLGARTLALHARELRTVHARLSSLAQTRSHRLLMHRAASPFSAGDLEERLLRSADLSVYDFDDALQWDVGSGIRSLRDARPQFVRSIRSADRVIAGNPTLGDFASLAARDVVVIPSCVEPDRYRAKTDFDLADPPRLGWIGSLSTEPSLTRIADALLEVHRRTGARLQIVGSSRGQLGALETMVDRVAWSEIRAQQLPATWDVGLMAMTDHLLHRGKCAYKLLQYGAASLPSVSSPVGINRFIATHAGFASASTTDDWVDQIMAVLDASTSARRRLGLAARHLVQERYSYEVWQNCWLSAMELTLTVPKGMGVPD